MFYSFNELNGLCLIPHDATTVAPMPQSNATFLFCILEFLPNYILFLPFVFLTSCDLAWDV